MEKGLSRENDGLNDRNDCSMRLKGTFREFDELLYLLLLFYEPAKRVVPIR
jgi:hypothetical protein